MAKTTNAGKAARKKSGRAGNSAPKRAGAKKRARKPVTPDPKLVKALAHPLRMRFLARLNENAFSPAELAREFGVSVPLASYHVTILRELGCLELVRETPVRGAVEHHYRATRRAYLSDQEWAAIDVDLRQSVTGAVLTDAVSDALAALQTGDMDRRDDRHLSFTTLNLDEQAWNQVNAMLDDLLETALGLQAESAGRLLEAEGAGAVRSRLTILHYEPVPERPSTGVEPARGRRAGSATNGGAAKAARTRSKR